MTVFDGLRVEGFVQDRSGSKVPFLVSVGAPRFIKELTYASTVDCPFFKLHAKDIYGASAEQAFLLASDLVARLIEAKDLVLVDAQGAPVALPRHPPSDFPPEDPQRRQREPTGMLVTAQVTPDGRVRLIFDNVLNVDETNRRWWIDAFYSTVLLDVDAALGRNILGRLTDREFAEVGRTVLEALLWRRDTFRSDPDR